MVQLRQTTSTPHDSKLKEHQRINRTSCWGEAKICSYQVINNPCIFNYASGEGKMLIRNNVLSTNVLFFRVMGDLRGSGTKFWYWVSKKKSRDCITCFKSRDLSVAYSNVKDFAPQRPWQDKSACHSIHLSPRLLHVNLHSYSR